MDGTEIMLNYPEMWEIAMYLREQEWENIISAMIDERVEAGDITFTEISREEMENDLLDQARTAYDNYDIGEVVDDFFRDMVEAYAEDNGMLKEV